MKSKAFISLLIVVMMISSQSLLAYDFESDGIFYNINSSAEMTVCVSSNGDNSYRGAVVIPEYVEYYGNTYKVTAIENCAFRYCTMLNTIKFPSSLTSIGINAFQGCTMLREVEIPTNVKDLGVALFKDCTNLVKVNIPKSVTRLAAGFDGCNSLKTLIIDDSDLELEFTFPNPNSFDMVYVGRNTEFLINDFHRSSVKIMYVGKKVSRLNLGANHSPKLNNVVSLANGDILTSNDEKCENLFISLDQANKYSKSCNRIFPLNSNIAVVPTFTNREDYDSYLVYSGNENKSAITFVFLTGSDSLKMTVDELKERLNSNCIFYSLSGIYANCSNFYDHLNQNANNVQFKASEGFDVPVDIFISDVELSYTPAVWADGQSGWEVITLPFEPTSIEASVSGSIVPITTNSKGNFWLRQYVGSSDDAVYFASTSDGVMKANTPYLIAFPGDKMGKGSLEGQTITFKAKNVTIPVTTIPSIQKNGYTFVGNYDKTADEGGGWTLNAEGSVFVWSETVGDKPFSGYFKGEAPTASSAALRMSFGQMDNTTGLEQNMAELIDCADEAVYTLDGRKVIAKDLKPGLYIKNNKKMMVR